LVCDFLLLGGLIGRHDGRRLELPISTAFHPEIQRRERVYHKSRLCQEEG
jgi:hypothetical protein